MKRFTLIEMIVIIAIIAILATLLMPVINQQFQSSKEKLNIAQATRIVREFTKFTGDVRLQSHDHLMEDILQYGLWPLIQEQHPLLGQQSKINYDTFSNFEHGIGRNMPYFKYQTSALSNGGSAIPNIGSTEQLVGFIAYSDLIGSYKFPVLLDPYQTPYQVIAPLKKQLSKHDLLLSMGICSLGENGILDITINDFDDNGIYKPQGGHDDLFIPLFPQYQYQNQGK